MRALYLHGYKSKPHTDRISILESAFEKVYAPLIDWDGNRNGLFEDICSFVLDNDITHVIGFSMGGQMAFFVAMCCNIEGICFNPAFGYKFDDFGFTWNENFDNRINVILGLKDYVIDYKSTIDFLSDNSDKLLNSDIHTELFNIGHEVPMNVFSSVLDSYN